MTKRALLIGVSQYEAGLPPLAAAPNDVTAMLRVLQSPELGAFDEVTTLFDPDLVKMQTAIALLFKNCHKGDLRLLYFSGHGIINDEGKLYFATRITSKDNFTADAVPASFIQERMRDHSHERQQVLILDCCFSGAFASGWLPKGDINNNLKPQLEVEGSVVLTSSTSTQKSYEDKEGELSLYTKYIVQGIESGAAESDDDGFVSADELHEYAKRLVQATKPVMKPEIYGFKQGIKIRLSKVRVNTELEYRRLVEKYASENDTISFVGHKILEIKRESWKILDDVAIRIENEVLEPVRKRLENLAIYKESLEKAFEEKFPLTEKSLEELKELQELLGLRDKDIDPIKQHVKSSYESTTRRRKLQLVENPRQFFRLFKWNFIAITGGVVSLIVLGATVVNVWFQVKPSPPRAIDNVSSSMTGSLNKAIASLDNVNTSLPNSIVLEMDGSTTMVKVVQELRDAYKQINPSLPTTYGVPDGQPKGSSPGIQNLINGTVLIAATSRPLKAEEAKSGLQAVPIGKDAIGVVVGINNPFKNNLTKDQVRDIYLGNITNWSQVGGIDRPIKVINRATTSGTRDDFQDIVLRGQNFATDSTNFITWKQDETTAILRDLGDNGISYATVSQLKDEEIVRIIEIDGVIPTDDEAIKSGRYPIIRNIFLAIKKTTSPEAKQFIKFALSPKGQEIVKKRKFTPLD
jgi:phosphate transport system substrate-binding protein